MNKQQPTDQDLDRLAIFTLCEMGKACFWGSEDVALHCVSELGAMAMRSARARPRSKHLRRRVQEQLQAHRFADDAATVERLFGRIYANAQIGSGDIVDVAGPLSALA